LKRHCVLIDQCVLGISACEIVLVVTGQSAMRTNNEEVDGNLKRIFIVYQVGTVATKQLDYHVIFTEQQLYSL
jgi:hypothetical protein